MEEQKQGSFFKDWVLPIILAFIIAILIKQFLVFKVEIPTGSMIPTLNVNDQLFVTRVYNLENLQHGDILVFESKELDDILIKRLIGLPGDKIDIIDGIVYINEVELQEDYVVNKDNWYGSYEVPEGKYFFLGDNRPTSFDSRKWEDPYIPGECIQAKAQLKVYPFKDFGSIK